MNCFTHDKHIVIAAMAAMYFWNNYLNIYFVTYKFKCYSYSILFITMFKKHMFKNRLFSYLHIYMFKSVKVSPWEIALGIRPHKTDHVTKTKVYFVNRM